jgi:hypothetical protein
LKKTPNHAGLSYLKVFLTTNTVTVRTKLSLFNWKIQIPAKNFQKKFSFITLKLRFKMK